jgi:integrase
LPAVPLEQLSRNGKHRYLPPAPRTRALRGSFLQHFWQKLLKGSGLRCRKFHSTRHTFITWAAEGCEALGIAPAPILAVRDWAGHSSVQETERYFHRVNRRAHARHVDGLDRYVQGDDRSPAS